MNVQLSCMCHLPLINNFDSYKNIQDTKTKQTVMYSLSKNWAPIAYQIAKSGTWWDERERHEQTDVKTKTRLYNDFFKLFWRFWEIKFIILCFLWLWELLCSFLFFFFF